RSRRDGLLYERQNAVGRGIADSCESDPAHSLVADLDRDHDERLLPDVPLAAAFFDTAEEELVDLDRSNQLVATRTHHRPAQLVEPCPRRAVAAEAENPLQSLSTGSVLLARHPPDRAEPESERKASVLEDGPGRDRGLVAALTARHESSLGRPPFG